jgi:hypothetical protein
LDDGLIGFFDHQDFATANTRTYDNFAVWAPPSSAVIYAGKTVEFRSDDTLRQDSTGTFYGRPPVSRGSRVFIPQSGSEGKVTRVVVKAARSDVEEAPRDQIADAIRVQVAVTPRYLNAPR